MLALACAACGGGSPAPASTTYTVTYAMLGVPAMTIKGLAGHVSIEATMRYMHLPSRVKGRAVAALDAAIEAAVASPLTAPSAVGETKLSEIN